MPRCRGDNIDIQALPSNTRLFLQMPLAAQRPRATRYALFYRREAFPVGGKPAQRHRHMPPVATKKWPRDAARRRYLSLLP